MPRDWRTGFKVQRRIVTVSVSRHHNINWSCDKNKNDDRCKNIKINNRCTNINNAMLDIECHSTSSFIVPTLLQPSPQQAGKSLPGPDERPRLLLRPRIHRHMITTPCKLVFSMFNIRSVNKKMDMVKQLMVDTDTDILCLTDTWHEDADAVCIKQFRQDGL